MRVCVSSVSPKKRERKLGTSNSVRLTLWPIAIILGVVALDQITKLWAVDALTSQDPVTVLGDFLRFTLTYNEGGAMGTRLGPSSSYLIIAIIILPLLLFYIYHHRESLATAVPLSFMAGGATGNLIDRIRLGRVIDFIDVDFFDFIINRWWTFNIADSAISCAIVFLLAHMMFQTLHRPTKSGDDSNGIDEPGSGTP